MNWIKALLVCCFLITGSAQAAEQPNILWIVCEDSSIDWFGCYGNKYAKTPNVDALAKQGFRYKNAYACVPVCAPVTQYLDHGYVLCLHWYTSHAQ